jgi:hypothetical protein
LSCIPIMSLAMFCKPFSIAISFHPNPPIDFAP